MKFINLTPHEVIIVNDNNKVVLRIPPSGQQLRLSSKSILVASLEGIPVYKTEFDLNTNEVLKLIQSYDEDTYFIVSTILLQTLKENGIRGNFIAPNTNPEFVVRDAQGKIIGVKGFQVL